jgi:hypothetical protein
MGKYFTNLKQKIEDNGIIQYQSELKKKFID